MNAKTPLGRKKTVAVAGATGFIGNAIGQALGEDFELIGLSRSTRADVAGYREFRRTDLFSRQDSIRALKGAQLAVYLVHSMMPSARLVDAHFRDLDLICADNFARAAAANGVEHIVYVGGLIPEDQDLSEHLESRVEVEKVLAGHGLSVTTLRAGMIVGGNGSSFQIVNRLVRRLPVMVCPSWTQTRMQPVALDDVVAVITAVLNQPSDDSRVYDLGGPDVLTYRQLMAKTAQVLGLRRLLLPIGLFSPKLSRLWVSLTTGAPKALVAPLVESLEHEMVARTDPELRHPQEPRTPVQQMLMKAQRESSVQTVSPRAFRKLSIQKEVPTALSVQRMALPPGKSGAWAADEYLRWLPSAFGGLLPIRVQSRDALVEFRIGKRGPVLLRLERRTIQDAQSAQVFRVTGGLLARKTERGRLEFRAILDGGTLLVALHEFVPRLPWWLYRLSQAIFHKWIMTRFAQHLASLRTGL